MVSSEHRAAGHHKAWLALEPCTQASESMSQVAIMSAMDDHRLRGTKQHRFILLYFWGSEVSSGSRWAKIMVSAGLWGTISFLAFSRF